MIEKVHFRPSVGIATSACSRDHWVPPLRAEQCRAALRYRERSFRLFLLWTSGLPDL